MKLFSQFSPVEIEDKGDTKYVLPEYPTPKSVFILNSTERLMNQKQFSLSAPLIQYQVNGNPQLYPIWTVDDCFSQRYRIRHANADDIKATLGEHIQRRMIKRFLQTTSPKGRLGGLFKPELDDHVVAETENHRLRINNYPNIVIERRIGHDYVSVGELDGLFDYRVKTPKETCRYWVIGESKKSKGGFRYAQLLEHIIGPLQKIDPDRKVLYILVSQKGSVVKNDALKPLYATLYLKLQEAGVQTIFFPFNETPNDFTVMSDHVLREFRWLRKNKVVQRGSFIHTSSEILALDKERMRLMHMINDTEGWKEAVPRHRQPKVKISWLTSPK